MGKFRIDTAAGRNKLLMRQAPYFVKIDQGQSIGYRKGKTGGAWVARIMKKGEKAVYHKIVVKVDDPQKEYGAALKIAQEWFTLQNKGVDIDYTLQQAIDDHTTYLKLEKSATVHKTAAAVLKGVPNRLKKTPVHKLTTHQLDKWRVNFLKQGDAEEVRKSQNTSNRRWSDLRACLNRAFQQGYVVDKTAWERITPYKKVQRGRQIFWSPKEANALLDAAKLHNKDSFHLLKAGLLTGCRVGELRTLKVKHFDRENEQLEVDGKTGIRDMELSPSAVKFFKEMAKSKHPEAFLLDYRGRQWPEDSHHKIFRIIRAKAEVDLESTFYCARHYYISQGLKADVSVDLISKNCGTSPDMIYQFYGKFTKKTQKKAAAQVDAALGIK